MSAASQRQSGRKLEAGSLPDIYQKPVNTRPSMYVDQPMHGRFLCLNMKPKYL